MRASSLFVLALLSTTACGGGDQASMETVNRRVTSLERRIGELEAELAGGKDGQAKGSPTKAEDEDKRAHGEHGKGGDHAKGGKDGVPVTAEGDATQVVLRHKQKSAPLPAEIPPGTYTWEATFADAGPPVSGSITLTAGTPAVVACTAATRSCVTR
jgi:hypothetical protein